MPASTSNVGRRCIKSWPEVKGVIYSDTQWVFNGKQVDYRVTTSTKSLDAYKTVGDSSYFS